MKYYQDNIDKRTKSYLHISAPGLSYKFSPSPRHISPGGPAGTRGSCSREVCPAPGCRLTRTGWRRPSCSRSGNPPGTQWNTPAQSVSQSGGREGSSILIGPELHSREILGFGCLDSQWHKRAGIVNI